MREIKSTRRRRLDAKAMNNCIEHRQTLQISICVPVNLRRAEVVSQEPTSLTLPSYGRLA
jgi:hypothetical protein